MINNLDFMNKIHGSIKMYPYWLLFFAMTAICHPLLCTVMLFFFLLCIYFFLSQFSRDQFILDCPSEKLRRELEEELKTDCEEPRSHAWYHGAIPRQVTHTHTRAYTHKSESRVPPFKAWFKTCRTRSPIISTIIHT